jgi:hypothetical protein
VGAPLKEQDVQGRPSMVFRDDKRHDKNKGQKKKKARLDRKGVEGVETPTEPKTMSWIWLSGSTTGTAEDVVESECECFLLCCRCTRANISIVLHIEWAKTCAKAMRYAEEVDLLEEETRCVLQFMDWQADWWMSLVGLHRNAG